MIPVLTKEQTYKLDKIKAHCMKYTKCTVCKNIQPDYNFQDNTIFYYLLPNTLFASKKRGDARKFLFTLFTSCVGGS